MTSPQTVLLTTIDNPFDPFKQFDEWFEFDVVHGYHSCALLARFARVSDDLSENENKVEIENAIDRILEIEPSGIYKKAVLRD